MVNGCTVKALLAIGHWFKSPMGAYLAKKKNRRIGVKYGILESWEFTCTSPKTSHFKRNPSLWIMASENSLFECFRSLACHGT